MACTPACVHGTCTDATCHCLDPWDGAACDAPIWETHEVTGTYAVVRTLAVVVCTFVTMSCVIGARKISQTHSKILPHQKTSISDASYASKMAALRLYIVSYSIGVLLYAVDPVGVEGLYPRLVAAVGMLVFSMLPMLGTIFWTRHLFLPWEDYHRWSWPIRLHRFSIAVWTVSFIAMLTVILAAPARMTVHEINMVSRVVQEVIILATITCNLMLSIPLAMTVRWLRRRRSSLPPALRGLLRRISSILAGIYVLAACIIVKSLVDTSTRNLLDVDATSDTQDVLWVEQFVLTPIAALAVPAVITATWYKRVRTKPLADSEASTGSTTQIASARPRHQQATCLTLSSAGNSVTSLGSDSSSDTLVTQESGVDSAHSSSSQLSSLRSTGSGHLLRKPGVAGAQLATAAALSPAMRAAVAESRAPKRTGSLSRLVRLRNAGSVSSTSLGSTLRTQSTRRMRPIGRMVPASSSASLTIAPGTIGAGGRCKPAAGTAGFPAATGGSGGGAAAAAGQRRTSLFDSEAVEFGTLDAFSVFDARQLLFKAVEPRKGIPIAPKPQDWESGSTSSTLSTGSDASVLSLDDSLAFTSAHRASVVTPVSRKRPSQAHDYPLPRPSVFQRDQQQQQQQQALWSRKSSHGSSAGAAVTTTGACSGGGSSGGGSGSCGSIATSNGTERSRDCFDSGSDDASLGLMPGMMMPD